MFLVFFKAAKAFSCLNFCTFGGYVILILCGEFLMDINSCEMRPADTKTSLNGLILYMYFNL